MLLYYCPMLSYWRFVPYLCRHSVPQLGMIQQPLNFEPYDLGISINAAGKYVIFDPIRKKKVALTPEEWVRQHLIQYLIQAKQTPKSLISVEQQLYINTLSRRADVVVYSRTTTLACLLVECKAPSVAITQAVFEQIAHYNMALQVPYLMVTNGLTHYFCYIDFVQQNYTFIADLPAYNLLSTAVM